MTDTEIECIVSLHRIPSQKVCRFSTSQLPFVIKSVSLFAAVTVHFAPQLSLLPMAGPLLSFRQLLPAPDTCF